MDDDYKRQVMKEMDAFSQMGKKDNWNDPHANASMAEMMRERKEAAEAKRQEALRLKMEEQKK